KAQQLPRSERRQRVRVIVAAFERHVGGLEQQLRAAREELLAVFGHHPVILAGSLVQAEAHPRYSFRYGLLGIGLRAVEDGRFSLVEDAQLRFAVCRRAAMPVEMIRGDIQENCDSGRQPSRADQLETGKLQYVQFWFLFREEVERRFAEIRAGQYLPARGLTHERNQRGYGALAVGAGDCDEG